MSIFKLLQFGHITKIIFSFIFLFLPDDFLPRFLFKIKKIGRKDFLALILIIPSLFPLAGLPFHVARKYFYGGENLIRPRLLVKASNFFASFLGGSWPCPRLRLALANYLSYYRVAKSLSVAQLVRLFTASDFTLGIIKEKLFERAASISADGLLKEFLMECPVRKNLPLPFKYSKL